MEHSSEFVSQEVRNGSVGGVGDRIFKISLTERQCRYINRLMPAHFILKKGGGGKKRCNEAKYMEEAWGRMLDEKKVRNRSRAMEGQRNGQMGRRGCEEVGLRGVMFQEDGMEERWFSGNGERLDQLREQLLEMVGRWSKWVSSDKQSACLLGGQLLSLQGTIERSSEVTFSDVERFIGPFLREMRGNKVQRLQVMLASKILGDIEVGRRKYQRLEKNESTLYGSGSGGEKREVQNERSLLLERKESKPRVVMRKRKRKRMLFYEKSRVVKGRRHFKSEKLCEEQTVVQEQVKEDGPITCGEAVRIKRLFLRLCQYDQKQLLERLPQMIGISECSGSFIAELKVRDLSIVQGEILMMLRMSGIRPISEADSGNERSESSFELEDESQL